MCLVLRFVSDWFCFVSVSLLCVVLFVLVFVVLLRARTMAPKAATIKARHGLTKKPASNVQPVKGLTTKQVTKHNKGNDSSALGDKMALFIKQCQQPGATVGVVEGFLKTLPANEQQLVWKEFEKHRVMAKSDQSYKTATSGTGAWAKKRALLFAWGQGGKEAKGSTWSNAVAEISTEKTDKLESTWQPLAAMLTKYGREELLSHLQCGSIITQRHPKNPKFFQFKDEVASMSAKNIQKSSIGHQKQGGSDQEAMRGFMKMNFLEDADVMKQLQDGDFVADSDSDEDPDEVTDMATLLGLKKGKQKKTAAEEEIDNKAHKGKGSKAIKDTLDEELDRASQVGDKEPHEKVVKKAQVVLDMLSKAHDKAGELMNTAEDKKVEKIMLKHVDKLVASHDEMQKMLKKAEKFKVPAIKELLLTHAKVLKDAYAAMNQHGA